MKPRRALRVETPGTQRRRHARRRCNQANPRRANDEPSTRFRSARDVGRTSGYGRIGVRTSGEDVPGQPGSSGLLAGRENEGVGLLASVPVGMVAKLLGKVFTTKRRQASTSFSQQPRWLRQKSLMCSASSRTPGSAFVHAAFIGCSHEGRVRRRGIDLAIGCHRLELKRGPQPTSVQRGCVDTHRSAMGRPVTHLLTRY